MTLTAAAQIEIADLRRPRAAMPKEKRGAFSYIKPACDCGSAATVIIRGFDGRALGLRCEPCGQAQVGQDAIVRDDAGWVPVEGGRLLPVPRWAPKSHKVSARLARREDATIRRVVALGVEAATPSEMAIARAAMGEWRKASHVRRRPCVACASLRTVAHHFSYRKPTLVIWLCYYCHAMVHRILKEKHLP